MNTFVNFTNHPSNQWSKKQINEALKYGKIVDVSFPNVSPYENKDQIVNLAKDCVDNIIRYNPKAVLCQGEFTLVFFVVKMLSQMGITVLAACSERIVKQNQLPNGVVEKSVIFEFIGFREYF